jgi:hypothetical protein
VGDRDGIFLGAGGAGLVLTARLGERAARSSPSGLDRIIRVLMDEIEETRQREQQRGPAEVAVLAPRDAESRAAP